MKKIGAFRITGKWNMTYTYEEAYARGAEFLEALYRMAQKGDVSLFCACHEQNDLPLMITKSNVIRVASNNQQELHMDCCPKSTHYTTWVAENEQSQGVVINEDMRITFHIAIPSGVKSTGGSSSSASSGESNPDPFRKRTAIYDMCRIVNCLAFQKQGYSIKKQIGIARKEGRVPDWRYKNKQDFNRLWYGVSNDVDIKHRDEVEPLHNILYHANAFFKADFKEKFFVYAEVDKLHEYKEGRKYQYITLKMPSNVSATKAVVRFASDEYESLKDELDGAEEGITFMLCGYVRHDTYRPDNEPEKQYITLLKYAVLPISDLYGVYLRHPLEAPLLHKLMENQVLFYRPWNAVSEYGDNIPSIIIQKKNGKDLLVDICKSDGEYEKRRNLSVADYETLILNTNYNVEDAFAEVMKRVRKV